MRHSEWRYVYQCRGGFKWRGHGSSSKVFESARDAAIALAKKLEVKLEFFKPGRLAPQRKCAAGVQWHRKRIGYKIKSGKGGFYFTETAALKALKQFGEKVSQRGGRKSLKRKRTDAQVCVSQYMHVSWRSGKEAFTIDSRLGLGSQYYTSDLEAAEVVADWFDCEVDDL